MNNYSENEIKVLNIDVGDVEMRLKKMHAKPVYMGQRTISTFDYSDSRCHKRDTLIRLTEEGTVKITVHINNSALDGNRKIIKLHPLENVDTCKDFLFSLGLQEKTRVTAKRSSYEMGKIDFDIDEFPVIPPFLEIDVEKLDMPLDLLLHDLGLEKKQIVDCGTEEIFRMYGIDYYSVFLCRSSINNVSKDILE